jgi:DNA helicase-2/ATP-dependent DNA helicase PcrA
VVQKEDEGVSVEALELNWRNRHVPTEVEMKDLLKDRMRNYRISPTHLNAFTDVMYAGPRKFYENTILKFPQAQTASSLFGDAVHATLDFVQRQKKTEAHEAIEYFVKDLGKRELSEDERALLIERGTRTLESFVGVRGENLGLENARSEVNFRGEVVVVDGVRLTGKIDRIEIDEENKLITVVDYKTGPSHGKWSKSVASLHKYRQQLCVYKLLVEGSGLFKGYRVDKGRLEFVEPDDTGAINFVEMKFDSLELERTKRLLRAVWDRIMAFDFPEVSGYAMSVYGIRDFEEFLLQNMS